MHLVAFVGGASPCHRDGERAGAFAEDLVRDARLCQGRKVVCFLQGSEKFKSRYSTFGFNDSANLDQGVMWPVAFALRKMSPAEEKKITGLVKKAVR